MVAAGLIASRFLHYLAVLILFGVALYPLYSYRGSERVQPFLLKRLRHAMLLAALTATLTGVLWFMFSVATMSDSFSSAFDAATLSSVLDGTDFGRVWFWRLVLGAGAAAACLVTFVSSSRNAIDLLVLVSATLLLASIAGTGHTQSYEGNQRLVHMLSDGAHLLAAGAWLGALVALALLVAPSTNSSSIEAQRILARFSAVGTVAVAILVGTGLIDAWFLVGSVSALFGTPYGELLLAKVCAFGAMVMLAGLNRLWLTPALQQENATNQPPKSLTRLRYHIYAEQALGVTVIFIVAMLGTWQPAAVPA